MGAFLLRSLGYGFFWFCVFSIGTGDEEVPTYFDRIHEINTSIYDDLNSWLDGK